MKKYDIAVIGGGFAGVAAAIAAAREGAKVLLVEKGNCLGGTAVHSLVTPFMRYTAKLDGEATPINAGIFLSIVNELKTRSTMHRASFSAEYLKIILNDMVLEAGVELLFHAKIFKAKKNGEKIKSVCLATTEGVTEIAADYFIDASGDAQLAFLANCPTRLGREEDNLCQPMTLSFRLGNVDIDKFLESREKLKEAHKKALENGELINPKEDILLFLTPEPNVIHFNTTRVVKLNPVDPFDKTEAEIIGRRQVLEMFEFLKKHAGGMENAFLMMTAAEIGVRESRMIVGEHTLTEAECKDFTMFPDSVAACNYCIDIHNPEGTGTQLFHFPEDKYYTIPYRCLLPKNTNNLLVAGRCISADHHAQASLRTMPTVCCLGEAAGTAAAIAGKSGVAVNKIDIKTLQASLKANGAFLGI